jgi:DNA-binding beta-propeller fold protein YncE
VTAIAAVPAGGFLVAIAQEGSVQRFDVEWQPAGSWELPAKQPVPAWPTGLSVEPGGDVLAVDRHNGRILVLDGSGTPEGFGAGHGWEPGLLLYPAGIDRLDDGRFVVADQGNSRVQIFQRTDRAKTQ